MANTCVWRTKYSISAISCAFVLLFFVPCTDSMRMGMPMHRICVPQHTNRGYIVTKILPDPQCLEMNHLSKSKETVTNPLHIRENGYLVINSSLEDRVQDIFIVKTKPLPECNRQPVSPVSDSNQIHIEVVKAGDSLIFARDRYEGTVSRYSSEGTVVEGLDDLFACVSHDCGNDVKYDIHGENAGHFSLRTVDIHGQRILQIFTKDSLKDVKEETIFLVISAKESKGLEGHTNVEIHIKPHSISLQKPVFTGDTTSADNDAVYNRDTLFFHHHAVHSRRKRETEAFPPQTFNETQTGDLFSVAPTPANPDWEYNLKSSTLENYFQVSRLGLVSLVTGKKFDYEDPNGRSASIVITVSRISDNIVVKDIQVDITIKDVNDEAPIFTNPYYPYLAVAQAGSNPNVLVYTLSATDPDAGANLVLQGDLTTAQQQLFTVETASQGDGKVKIAQIKTTGAQLIQDQEYTLRILATDTAAPMGPTRSSTAEVKVKAGERPPQFPVEQYSESVQEENNVGQVINADPITARSFQDRSIGYQILDNQNQPSTFFAINSERKIYALQRLDFENPAQRLFSLNIRATEESPPFLQSSVPLTVTVTDFNEEAPRFPVSAYNKEDVREDVPVGTSLLQVSASDGDYNQTLSFTVNDDHFKVDSVVSTSSGATAIIRVNKRLDYDRISPKMYIFSVIATDSGVVPKSGSTLVIIRITNVNDEPPLFPVNATAGIFMTANIRYDYNTIDPVYTVQASDVDADDGITYSLVSNQFGGLFTINQQDGTIRLTRRIVNTQDQLTVFKYELQVVATDDGACCGSVNRLTSTGTVTINILTDNIHDPTFDQCSSYTPSVNENAANEFIIRVTAQDGDTGSNGEVTYSIRSSASSDNFRINATTGELFTARAIDREALPGPSIIVNILARDGGGREGTCPLFVKINDLNDNAPVFAQQDYSFNIKNDLPVGSSAFQVRATDRDAGQNAVVSYSLINNPGEYFYIDQTFDRSGIVRVNQTLPNTEQVIQVVVQAKDNGSLVQLTNTTTVSARIVKRQDQFPPAWTQPSFSATVSESEPLLSNLVNISAKTQSNQLLSFTILGGSDLFEVTTLELVGDLTYGVVKNKGLLDYETKINHEITVRALDLVYGGSSDVTVSITVEDANDELPEFLEKIDGNLELSLPEGNYTQVPSPGHRVGEIRVRDRDARAPFNQIQQFRIKNYDGTFTLQQSTSDLNVGILYTQSAFDRESVPKDVRLVKTLIVEAIDAAPSSLPSVKPGHNTGQVVVRITITDVNDNPPSFAQSSYNYSINEDKDIGFLLEPPLTADDPDSDAELTYEMRGPGPFRIQRTTGFIETTSQLDYDLGRKEYPFVVEVSDQVNKGSASVTIYILDVNDNPPEIPDYEFNDFKENETSVVGVIKNINATDIDNGGVNTFYYDLKFTDDLTAQYFSINRVTGELSIVKPLDRDYPNGKAEFQFTVEVADAPLDRDPLFGRSTITVRPIDINDNDPFFPAAEAQMKVKENSPDVTNVGRVVVVDYDEGLNSQTELSLLQQSQGNNFNYNAATGYIETVRALDREAQDTYYIVMQAVDKGTPQRTGTGTLTITVLDDNDSPPYFTREYEFILPETQKDGPVGTIQANDSDIGENAVLIYSLATADLTHFQMLTISSTGNLNQGQLTIFSFVDYDKTSPPERSFNLTAYASDSKFTATTSIHIIVTDANDETPTFDNDQKSEDVSEAENPGYYITNFHAVDRDVNSPYNLFTYHIQQKSDPLNQFAIDQYGNVTLRNKLDRETKASHEIKILAIDNPKSMPQNTGTATLLVTVLDINDNFPDFAQPYPSPSIAENSTYTGREILEFTVIDRDLPENGPPFTFNLNCNDPQASSQCGKFTISYPSSPNANNGIGKLSVTGIFDREQESKIRLPVRMCDRLNLCGNRYMDVEVMDINDNPHGPGYQYILVYNYKGLFGNIPIGEVNSNDPDEINDDKEYRLTTLEAAVFVDVAPNTGIITLKENVPEMIFSFDVRVRGIGSGPSADIVTTSKVTVNIVYIPEDAVYSSGSVRLKGISDKDFLRREKQAGTNSLDDTAYELSMYEKFRKMMAEKLDTDLANVNILSVMYNASGDFTDVRIAAHGSPWYQSSRLDGIVATNIGDFEQIVGQGAIDMVPVDMCRFETCEGGCYNDLVVSDTPKLVTTRGASFVGVNTEVVGKCGCKAKMFPSTIDCTPGYCYHGGKCVKDKWNVISCECPEGFEGPRCQQLRHSFNGTGYALYKQLEQCANSRTSIEILTDNADGLILYNGPVATLGQADPTDFILLELRGGHPRLRINHGTGELMLEIPTSPALNDGTWHRIDIHRKEKEVKLIVDHCINAVSTGGTVDRSNCEAVGVTPGENKFINTDQVLQLGGRFSTPAYPAGVTTAKFDGCMKNLIHNAEIYDLSTGDIFPGSKDGCEREDNACQTPCGNGQCLITNGSAICNCDPGWRQSSSSATCDTVTIERDFHTSSFLDWRLKDAFMKMLNSRKTTLIFSYRSRDTDGLLFSVVDQNQSTKYIKVKIVGGLLQATYNLGDGPVTVSLSNVPADDGQWHRVTIQRLGKELMLKMDSGEGRYYTEFLGPENENANLDLNIKQTEVFSGANLIYSGASTPDIFQGNEEDYNGSCINDIRLENSWFPMKQQDDAESQAATIQHWTNTQLGCVREDCLGKCQSPLICIPLWGKFDCGCRNFFERAGQNCTLIDYCQPNRCVGSATCRNNNPCDSDSRNDQKCSGELDENEQYFTCDCTGEWYGNLCQCHPSLNSGGEACLVVPPPGPIVSTANVGLIVGIIVGVVFALILAAVLIYLLLQCRNKPEEKEPFDDDEDDDIRENIMYYDEEGAGEEDQTAYDLSRLRKPDDGDRVRPWDAPDIQKTPVKPLGAHNDRPDIGDFINNRLDDADDDPNSPPFDTPIGFEFEGGNSSVGSLSSLNTSSSGDQDYDYLNDWGPKFAKLADMYNNYDETE